MDPTSSADAARTRTGRPGSFEPGPDDADVDPRERAASRLGRPTDANVSLDRLAELAAQLLGTAAAQVSVISDVQTVRGGAGRAAQSVGTRSPAPDSLCTVTVGIGGPLVVPDARTDARVSSLPPVTSGSVGSYLGVPLVTHDGHTIGALCVYDSAPRDWLHGEVALLEQLATPVVAELELAALGADYEASRVVWQVAVDAARIGAFDWHILSGELRWDDRLLELFGQTREDFSGTIEAFDTALHPEDVGRVSQAIQAAVDTCGAYDAEFRVVHPDGTVRWISARGHALSGEDGTAVRLLGAAFDTTAVRAGEARVARVLETMPSAFFHLDREWRFTYANAEAERLLGTTREELEGETIWDLFPAAVGTAFEDFYRGAVESGQPASFDAYYPAPLEAWYDVRAWPNPDGLSVYFVDVTARHQQQRELSKAAQRLELLAAVTDELTGTLEVHEAVGRLAPLVVPALADWCIVSTVDEGPADWRHRVHDVGWWHADPALLPTLGRYAAIRLEALSDSAFVAQALASDEPVLVSDDASGKISAMLRAGEPRELFERLGADVAAVMQLWGRGRTVGLLSVFRTADRGPFDGDDADTLRDLAARAGLALDNARLFAEQRELAEGLQRSLLTPPPAADHLQIAVRYEPAAQAAQVGGDWYDSFLRQDGSTFVVIGDVVGHDTAAAAAMGQVRSMLRAIAVQTDDGPAGVLEGVDRAMAVLRVDTTATVVVARLEQTAEERAAGTTRLRWSNAGHPPPMVVRPDGTVSLLVAPQPDLLLGLDPSTSRREQVVTLERGSTLMMYTDGLVERRGQSLDDGFATLERALGDLAAQGLPLEDVCDRVLRRMLPETPEDDVALVAVRLHPEDRPLPPG